MAPGDVRAGPRRAACTRAARPIRVLRIIDRLNVGGPAKHVVWLTRGLDPNRFDARLVTGTTPPEETDMGYFADAAGLRPVVIHEMSRNLSVRDLLVIGRLLRLLRSFAPDIVHTHKAKAGAVGRTATFLYRWSSLSALRLRPRRCRAVHTYHGHVFHSYYGRVRTALVVIIERALARLCTDRIVVVSPQQRREVCEQFRVGRPEQFRVIPLGIDFEELRATSPGLRTQLRLGPDDILVGTVGRLTNVKNHALLLQGAARLRADLTGGPWRARFVIVGEGELRRPLETLAARLGLDNDVSFVGFRPDAPALYGDLDVVALTSRNEGTPLTLIEAMACGRPVAATEVGGVVDLMGRRLDSVNGFAVWDHGVTVPSDDVSTLACALRFLIERPMLRRQMGERGRAFARRTFAKERLLEQVDELYRALVEEEGAG